MDDYKSYCLLKLFIDMYGHPEISLKPIFIFINENYQPEKNRELLRFENIYA